MTIKEALVAALDEVDVKDATLDKVLADQGLESDDEYNAAENENAVDLCLIRIYKMLLVRPSISEGGYSRGALTAAQIQAALGALYNKWSISDPDAPKVRAVNMW